MGLISDVGRGAVAIDTAVFIYFIEEEPRFLPQILTSLAPRDRAMQSARFWPSLPQKYHDRCEDGLADLDHHVRPQVQVAPQIDGAIVIPLVDPVVNRLDRRQA